MKVIFFIFFMSVSYCSFAVSHGVKYPDRAEKLRITGHVMVLYDIGLDGLVKNIRFIEAEPKYVFEKEVRKGMMHWRFPLNIPRTDVPHEFTFAVK